MGRTVLDSGAGLLNVGSAGDDHTGANPRAGGLAIKNNLASINAMTLDLYKKWRTPEHDGVDMTGVADSTTAMQNWLNAGIAGDPLLFTLGTPKISDELVASGSGLICLGMGINRSVITQSVANKNGIRFQIPGGGAPCGFFSNVGVVGPAANPTDLKAAFVLDASPGFKLDACDAGNFDIGVTFVNNNYNAKLYDFSCHRFNSCNVGIYLRGFDTGFEAGNDISFYDAVLSNRLANVIIGPGGGYHFFGGQFGTSGLAADRDDLAAIMLGIQYDSVVQSGTGTTTTGSCTGDFNGLSIEGVNRAWFIQSYDENTASFLNMGYTPSVTGLAAALGLFSAVNSKSSIFVFDGSQSIQNGGVFKTAIARITGAQSALCLREAPWQQGALTVNGVSRGRGTMRTLGAEAGVPQVSHGWCRTGSLPVYMMGNVWLRPSAASGAAVPQYSNDGGNTWQNI